MVPDPEGDAPHLEWALYLPCGNAPIVGIEAHLLKTGLLSGWGDQNRKTRPGNLAQGSAGVVNNGLIVLC